MANNTIYQTPPIGSRPPFGTDDDHLYEQQPKATRRLKQPQDDPNARTSAYNMYDHYMEDGSARDSSTRALGNALLNGNMDDDDEEDPFDDRHRPVQTKQQPIPLAAPKPGYAAPVAALNLAPPSPSASPVGRQQSPQQHPRPLMLVNSLNSPTSPRMASPGISGPSTPRPLPPTITPIQPAFVRPSKGNEDRDVKFAASTPILRGEKEETLLPRRGERGDDFWRRFSIVVKQERALPQTQKESAWLRKTQNGTTRLSRWVWIIGICLLIAIAGSIGLGLYISSQNKSHSAPEAIGGSANEKPESVSASISTSDVRGSIGASSSSLHVSPTHTVARRDDILEVVPTGLPPVSHPPASFSDPHAVRVVPPSRHRRVHHNRTET